MRSHVNRRRLYYYFKVRIDIAVIPSPGSLVRITFDEYLDNITYSYYSKIELRRCCLVYHILYHSFLYRIDISHFRPFWEFLKQFIFNIKGPRLGQLALSNALNNSLSTMPTQ